MTAHDPKQPPQPAVNGLPLPEMARRAGLYLLGVCPAMPGDHEQAYRQWIADGKHGEMAYLARNVDLRLDPGKLVDGAQAVICVADAYPSRRDVISDAAGGAQSASATGKVAAYAMGRDYHKQLKRRLHRLADTLARRFPDGTFRSTVDTAPILEREHAARAGLGWIGKHTLVIHPKLGSYLLLGCIVTTVPPDRLGGTSAAGPVPDHCGTCTRCIDACPTQCITPYSIDASQCVSYLTIEHRCTIAADLHGPMGDWLAGCDVCQDVCPHNRHPQAALPIDLAYQPRLTQLDALAILDWTEDDRRAAVSGTALTRIKLNMFKRNALIVLGNALAQGTADGRVIARIRALAVDMVEPGLVRDTAQQVLDRLG